MSVFWSTVLIAAVRLILTTGSRPRFSALRSLIIWKLKLAFHFLKTKSFSKSCITIWPLCSSACHSTSKWLIRWERRSSKAMGRSMTRLIVSSRRDAISWPCLMMRRHFWRCISQRHKLRIASAKTISIKPQLSATSARRRAECWQPNWRNGLTLMFLPFWARLKLAFSANYRSA